MHIESLGLVLLLARLAWCQLAKGETAMPAISPQGGAARKNHSHPFLESIFSKYGHDMIMTFEGFEHLLENLELGHLVIDDHEVGQHKDGPVFRDFHEHHQHGPCFRGDNCTANSTAAGLIKESKAGASHGHHHDHEKDAKHGHHDHKKRSLTDAEGPAEIQPRRARAVDTSDVPLKKCLTARQILLYFGISDNNQITPSNFREVCPALVSQLDFRSCYHPQHDYTSDDKQISDENGTNSESTKIERWDFFSIPAKVWGFASLAVLVISLAGLVGVAAVPLMRRVFYVHVLHFLVALAVGSLTGDAILHLIPHALTKEDSHNHEESGGHDNTAVLKGLMVLGGVYTFFIAEQLMSAYTARKRRLKMQKEEPSAGVGTRLSDYNQRQASCEDVMLDPRIKETSERRLSDDLQEAHMMQLSEKEVEGHGHSHGDGKVPQSIAAVAWMVIMGDGLHNLCDGLAIGAAFAASITGGFSTSVAVFCHELPHELGDFAMLLRAGMSVKQALVYNMLSSFLCFVGMVIGVALGNMTSASMWIFALVGGMFIYIALVDMLPEITSSEAKRGTSLCCHLLVQCGGIGLGTTIMLLIALFEEQLKTSLSS